MPDGVRSTELDVLSSVDSLLGNKDGSTGRYSIENLAAYLAASGAVAQAISTVEGQVVSGLVSKATWTDLQGITPSVDGTGGEVLSSDAGTHSDATATGYDGSTVNNAGRYSWNDTWGRWVRIGDSGYGTVAGDLADHEADTDNPHSVTVAQLSGTSDDMTQGTVNLFLTAAQQAKLNYLLITGSWNLDAAKAKLALLSVTEAVSLDGMKAKVDNITVTEPINLDTIGTSLDTVTSLAADLERIAVHTEDRPGENPGLFSGVLIGAGVDKTPLDAANIEHVAGQGDCYVVTGAGTVARRDPVALSEDVWEFTARFRRTENPSDPSGNAILLRVAWLDGKKNLISYETLASVSDAVFGPVYELSARVSRLSVSGVIAPPGNANFACVYVQSYGEDGTTAVITLRAKEVTDLHAISSADLSQIIADAEAATDAANNAAELVATETLDTMAAVTTYDRASGVGALTIKGGVATFDGEGGQWVYDPDDTTTPHEPPFTLVGNDGARYKIARAFGDGAYRAVGLSLSIRSLTVSGISGDIEVPAASLALPASETVYVVVDAFTGAYRYLPRLLHDGCVPVARVTTNASRVTEISELPRSLPASRIPRFLSKLEHAKQDDQIRIATFGTSLTDGAGGGPRWPILMFDPDGDVTNTDYILPNLSRIVWDEMATGGSNIELGMAFVAEATKPLGDSLVNRAHHLMIGKASRHVSPPDSGPRLSDVISDPYDLAIVGYSGANAGTLEMHHLEVLIAGLRRAGTEVVIITENGRESNPTGYFENGLQMRRIADAMGCAFVDTDGYMYAGTLAGQAMYDDGVHQSTLGHEYYAEALSSVLAPKIRARGEVNPDPRRSVGAPDAAQNSVWAKLGGHAHLQVDPVTTTGTRDQQGRYTTPLERIPSIVVGGKTETTWVTVLEAGEVAEFSHPHWSSVHMLFDPYFTFTAKLTRQNGTADLISYEHASVQVNRVLATEPYFPPYYTSYQRADYSVQVECLTGTLKLVGMVFGTDYTREVPFGEITFNGTWATEAGRMSDPFTYYTDTDGDYLAFEFEGSACLLTLGRSPAGGLVDVYLDGQLYEAGVDLYDTAWRLTQYRVEPGAYGTPKQARRHVVQVRLNGANASAGTPSSPDRRLALYAAYALETGW
ncbi:SGNH/GDSL hydrolase family protein [Salipiger mucosus]|uniref:Uncharacterized protein n=1 Tax=Salipiger mucosus DSM 16094 TaxID=1123237 RepID=S9QR73_9RHOB|nr:SGNH/GDSL hydrolase family protein [Salipiger mucosus]EPX82108.1 hypothetical protein Salmuc_02476 [Salipiger mucosus DSM 16094]